MTAIQVVPALCAQTPAWGWKYTVGVRMFGVLNVWGTRFGVPKTPHFYNIGGRPDFVTLVFYIGDWTIACIPS
jgi:hypothetical protein